MIRTNEDKLVKMSVVGEISSPGGGGTPYRITAEGKAVVLPGVGGITYNIKVGDCAVGWEADHVEPGVSTKNKDSGANGGYNLLACVGNEAKVLGSEAKGAKGRVTGKHGGIEHVLIDFDDETLEKLTIGDKIMIKGFGVGLRLTDFPDIKVMNMSPDLLRAMPLKGDAKKGVLDVHVTHKVPAKIMGSGLGSSHTYTGDYDIQLFDEKTVKEYNLDTLRFGDIIAIMDADHSYGRIYRSGAISIGVVSHSNCVTAGHGPGVATLFTSTKGKLNPIIDEDANIGKYLKIGRFRPVKKKKKKARRR